jgi:putative transposase
VARLGRYFLPDQPLHVIQRGNNRQAIFFGEEDYACYRDWLAAAAARYGCAVHAYVLMTNHLHLLLTPRAATSLPRTMQALGRRYVRYVNTVYRRSGTLWEGRYRAAPIDSEAYFLSCCRYIELNPVRARMVRQARDYRWSSYRAHGEGAPDPLLAGHELYERIGRTPADRQKAYKALFRTTLDRAFVEDLRAATNGGWALGNALPATDCRSARPSGHAAAEGPTSACQSRTAAIKFTLTPILNPHSLPLLDGKMSDLTKGRMMVTCKITLHKYVPIICMVVLVACSSRFARDEPIGTYILNSGLESDVLELKGSGYYTHSYQWKDSPKEVSSGKWQLDDTRDGQVVTLDHFHPLPREKTNGDGFYLLEPTRSFGSIRLVRNEKEIENRGQR